MSHDTFRKLVVLRQEVVSADELGPKKHVANALLGTTLTTAMWDASFLARELLPEVSLHFSRVQAKGLPPFHNLEYVLVRETNERFAVSEQALDNWLMDNSGVQREKQLETAILSVRRIVSTLSPDAQKKANRHLRLLVQELTSS